MARRQEAEANRQKAPQRPQGGSLVIRERPDRREGGEPEGWLDAMPLEILFEILGLVSPGDLLNVSSTNKLFYATLTATDAKSVWVASRGTLGAPEPPDNITEASWANLLFHDYCQVCGMQGATRVNLMLRRRVCYPCRKLHVVKMNSAWRKSDGYHEAVEVLPYILSSHPSGWFGEIRFPYASRCYWKEDAYPVIIKWRSLNDAVSDGLAGAEDAFMAWKVERAKWVEESRELSKEHEAWCNSLDEQYKSRTGAIRAQRLAAFRSNFVLLDYSTVDIDAALSVNTEGIKEGSAGAKEQAWDELIPKFERMIIARKKCRVEKELQHIVKPRIQIFRKLYGGFLSQLKPYDERHVPVWQFMRPLPGVSEYIDAEKDAIVTRHSFLPFIAKLPEHIANYCNRYKEAIISWIPTTDFNEGSNPIDMARFVFSCNAKYTEAREEGAEIQTTVVSCDSGLLHGWAMVSEHLQGCEGRHFYEKAVIAEEARRYTIKLQRHYSEIAASLITLAELGPNSTLITDMDQQDTFFVCGTCSPRRRYDVYTWRQALRHSREAHAQSDVAPTFRLASDDEKPRARAYNEEIEAQSLMWRCNHCPSFSVAGRVNVFAHMKDQHGTPNPMPEDYFVNKELDRSLYSYTYDLPRPGETLYYCLHCPEPFIIRRRFLHPGLLDHLRSKHRTKNPLIGVHYTPVDTS